MVPFDYGFMGPTHGGDDDSDDEDSEEELPKLDLKSMNLDSDHNIRDVLTEIIAVYKKAEGTDDFEEVVSKLTGINLKWHMRAIFHLIRDILSKPEDFFMLHNISFSDFAKYSILFLIDRNQKEYLLSILQEGALDKKVFSSLIIGIKGLFDSISSGRLPLRYADFMLGLFRELLRDHSSIMVCILYLSNIRSMYVAKKLKNHIMILLPGSSDRVKLLGLKAMHPILFDPDVFRVYVDMFGISNAHVKRALLEILVSGLDYISLDSDAPRPTKDVCLKLNEMLTSLKSETDGKEVRKDMLDLINTILDKLNAL